MGRLDRDTLSGANLASAAARVCHDSIRPTDRTGTACLPPEWNLPATLTAPR